MKPLFSIIIPSWNNSDYLIPCVKSIQSTGVLNGLGELIIVNNGDYPLKDTFSNLPSTKVIDVGENLGWEKGLLRGLKESEAPYVCFQNDDTVIPYANSNFYNQLLYPFHDPRVAAVGPATTVASGKHSIFQKEQVREITATSFLIFFTVMIERKAYDEAGGIDGDAPGGDDFDLSMRLRKLGRHLVINPYAFIIHHGFKSGTRLKGESSTANGWNSKEMIDITNHFLICKHRFRPFIETQNGKVDVSPIATETDTEGKAIREMVDSSQEVVELGCGAQKTVPWAIGIDRIEKGQMIPHVYQASIADICADVSKGAPEELKGKFDVVISRHILEHCVDTVETIKEWSKFLRANGRIIIAVPNHEIRESIPMNPEHVHAFVPSSLKNIMESCGFSEENVIDPKNNVSFVGVYRKANLKTVTTSNALEVCLA